MPRMTIYRSSLVALVVGVTVVMATPAAAQDIPATHTVRRGDTLWDLAGRYLGDPFLWPQIFRLNTDVVEDPHWIYPGEVLRLVPGADQPSAVPDEAPGEQVQAVRTGEAPVDGVPFWQQRRPTSADISLRVAIDDEYRPLRPGEFFSSGFLTEGERLPLGRLLGPVTPPQIRSISNRGSITLHSIVGILPPEGATYAPGDSLVLARLEVAERGYGDIVVPTGLARVTGTNKDQYVAEVVAIYGAIENGQVVLPAGRFPGPGSSRAVPVEDGLEGRVIGGRELRVLKHLQNVLFLDIGREAGVAEGDLFEIRRESGPRIRAADTIDELMAVGQVVHVRNRSATLLLLHVVSPDIPPQTLARQVAKLPS